MRIALISFEFFGHGAGGGIGTYTRFAADMLASRGHDVEVFTAGEKGESFRIASNARVNIVDGGREDFADRIAPVFAERHSASAFDVLEGPEFGAEAGPAADRFPEVPLVVKLHAPTFTIDESNLAYISNGAKLRFMGGALVRGRIPYNPWRYDPLRDPERYHTLRADEVVANSFATARKVGDKWGLPKERLSVVPYAFVPSEDFTSLPVKRTTRRVMFFGRLEVRKGVIELATAIPNVLRKVPDAKFRFMGRDLPHPADRKPVSEHIRKLAKGAGERLEILPSAPYGQLPGILSEADIAILPSHWEASGYVCMESMAAGCAVIGSASGGMAEIITDRQTGLLVPPRNPGAISSAIISLLNDPDKCHALAGAGREALIAARSAEQIAPLQEESYRRAIKNHMKAPLRRSR